MTDEVPDIKELAFDDDGETREQILAAAFDALNEHGYSDVTIEAIGEEFDKSQSLIYHHYDSKDDLLINLLEHLTDYFEDRTPEDHSEDPRERIETFVDIAIGLDDTNRPAMGTFIELRAQAVHEDDYREHFARSDRVVQELLAEDIRDGIESGVFRDVNPEIVSTFLQTMSIGVAFRSVTSDEGWTEANEKEVREYLESRLYK